MMAEGELTVLGVWARKQDVCGNVLIKLLGGQECGWNGLLAVDFLHTRSDFRKRRVLHCMPVAPKRRYFLIRARAIFDSNVRC